MHLSPRNDHFVSMFVQGQGIAGIKPVNLYFVNISYVHPNHCLLNYKVGAS